MGTAAWGGWGEGKCFHCNGLSWCGCHLQCPSLLHQTAVPPKLLGVLIIRLCGRTAQPSATPASPHVSMRGMTPVEICVTPGTTVTFDWTSGHNMIEVTSDSFWSCTGLSNTSPEAGPATWVAPSVPGMNYFACGVPGHCSNGMKALVEVKAVCPA